MSGYTTTPNLGLKKPIVGADDDEWGGHLNDNADVLDQVLTPAAAAAIYAPIASPAFTGIPTAPTPPPGDNDTSIATTAYVTAITAALVNAVNEQRVMIDALRARIEAIEGCAP